jgi:hypothetical protein
MAMNDSALLDRAAAPTAATEALGQSPIPILRRVKVEENSHKVILSGRLPSYYYKQLAQEAILPYLAGRELVNRVIVIAKG